MSKFKGFSLSMPKNYDKMVHACMLILLVFGSIMIASTSVGESSDSIQVVITAIIKQAVFLIVSYVLMTYMARNFVKFLSREVRVKEDKKENLKRKNRYRVMFKWIGFIIIGLLVLTLISPEVKGARSWIYLGPVSIQPSEFAKVYMIILLGVIVNDYGSKEITFFRYMKEPLLFFCITLVLLFMQPDFGTMMIFMAITAILLLIPTNSALSTIKKLILFGFGIAAIVFVFISTDFGISILEKLNLGYKFGRVTNAADPFNDIFGEGYNLVYSIYAIATGGISGLGLGASKQKFGYLPEAQSDFIFSVTIEELGLFGLAIIVVCYCIILYKLFYYAMKTKSEGFKMILIGCGLYMSIHFILNIGGVSGLIPLTGVPLLFISSGGSSLISIMFLFGICQSIIALTRGQMTRMENNRIK